MTFWEKTLLFNWRNIFKWSVICLKLVELKWHGLDTTDCTLTLIWATFTQRLLFSHRLTQKPHRCKPQTFCLTNHIIFLDLFVYYSINSQLTHNPLHLANYTAKAVRIRSIQSYVRAVANNCWEAVWQSPVHDGSLSIGTEPPTRE